MLSGDLDSTDEVKFENYKKKKKKDLDKENTNTMKEKNVEITTQNSIWEIK